MINICVVFYNTVKQRVGQYLHAVFLLIAGISSAVGYYPHVLHELSFGGAQ